MDVNVNYAGLGDGSPLWRTPQFSIMMWRKTSAAANMYRSIVDVDTGRLKGSVTNAVFPGPKGIYGKVHAHAPYAWPYEVGTGKTPAEAGVKRAPGSGPGARNKGLGYHSVGRYKFQQVLEALAGL